MFLFHCCPMQNMQVPCLVDGFEPTTNVSVELLSGLVMVRLLSK